MTPNANASNISDKNFAAIDHAFDAIAEDSHSLPSAICVRASHKQEDLSQVTSDITIWRRVVNGTAAVIVVTLIVVIGVVSANLRKSSSKVAQLSGSVNDFNVNDNVDQEGKNDDILMWGENIENENPNNHIHRPNRSARYNQIYDQLLPITNPSDLSEESASSITPQRQALLWLVDEDPKYVDPTNDSTSLLRRYILVVFYHALHGEQWTVQDSWLTGVDECTWVGVDCDLEQDSRVIGSIKIPRNNLRGTLPNELGALSSLKELLLFDNSIVGMMPSTICNMTQLETLALQRNMLQGSIPSCIHSLQKLKHLILNLNHLDGRIPSNLGNATSLEQLQLQSNRLHGTLPTSVGLLTSLRRMWLSKNKFHGAIPSEVGQLKNLEAFYIDQNFFSEVLPSEFAQASGLVDVRMQGNLLTGTLPASLGMLEHLEILRLEANFFTGTLPEFIGSFVNLEFLNLGFNRFTGSIPASLGNLNNLLDLSLSENQLIGTIPSSLGELLQLAKMHLNGNQLTGDVPPTLGLLRNLDELRLERNEFFGTLPVEVCSLDVFELVVDCTLACRCCSSCVAADVRGVLP